MTHPQPPLSSPSQRIISAKHINYDTTHPLYRETGTQYELEWQGVLKRKSFQQTPIGIVREIQKVQSRCFVGIFKDIRKAWACADKKLFIWSYSELGIADNEYVLCEESPDLIIQVLAVRPKPDVVAPGSQLVIVSTPAELLILELRTHPSLAITATNMSVPVETHMISLHKIPTAQGDRIIAGGENGCFYELHYYKDEGWFKRKCSLQQMTSASWIDWALPNFLRGREEPITQIQSDPRRSLLYTLHSETSKIRVFKMDQTAFHYMCDYGISTHGSIIHIEPTGPEDPIVLIAVTTSGVRIYLRYDQGRLSLSHVRSSPTGLPTHRAHIHKTNLIVAQVSPLNQNQDKILCTAPWPNSEAHGTADVDGRAWQIDSIDDTIWVVCVGGIYTYEKVDIVDIFCSLVRGGNNDDLLPIFIGRVGHAEIAWMCFQVICNSDFTNPALEKPCRDTLVRQRCIDLLYRICGRPTRKIQGLNSNNDVVGRPVDNDQDIQFSSLHDGAWLWVTRTLKPIWSLPLQAFCTTNSDREQAQLQCIHYQLLAFKHFCEVSPGNRTEVHEAERNFDAEAREAKSLHNLTLFIGQVTEMFSFFEVMLKHGIISIKEKLSIEMQKAFEEGRLYDLLISQKGRALAKEILTKLTLTSDLEISKAISQRCKGYFSEEDLGYQKAIEYLVKATSVNDPTERKRLINEANAQLIPIAKDVAGTQSRSTKDVPSQTGNVGSDRLSVAVDLLTQMHQYSVSINLILTAAHDLMAPQHYNPEHPEANPSADKRQSCFILLLRVLTMLQSKQALMSAREYQNTWARVLNVDDAQLHDVLFPWMEQTLANGKETLLSHVSIHVEKYLARMATQSAEHSEILIEYYVRHRKFGAASQNLLRLAESRNFQIFLAKRIEYLSYALNHAKSAINLGLNVDHQFADNDIASQKALILEMQDKLDVAFVQDALLSNLLTDKFESLECIDDGSQMSRAQAIRRLEDGGLWDLSHLFWQYAKPLGLYEIQLLIMYNAGQSNTAEMEDVWYRLIHAVASQHQNNRPFDQIGSKLQDLAATYGGKDGVFDPYRVIPIFTRFSYEGIVGIHPPTGWVSDIMKQCGIKEDQILDAFHDMLIPNNSLFRTSASAYSFVVRETTYLQGKCLENIAIKNWREAEFSYEEALDRLENYVSILHNYENNQDTQAARSAIDAIKSRLEAYGRSKR